MSSPIFDSTFGTGRFKSEEPMTTTSDLMRVRKLEQEIAELTPEQRAVFDAKLEARNDAAKNALAQSDAGPTIVTASTEAELDAILNSEEDTPIEILPDGSVRALAQSDARPAADAGLIEAAEWLSTAASRFEEAADALRSEYKTYARQMDRWAGDTRERARLFRILSRAAERGVHGELIPDCPTDGVAARQGNGG